MKKLLILAFCLLLAGSAQFVFSEGIGDDGIGGSGISDDGIGGDGIIEVSTASTGDAILWDASGDKILWDASGDEVLWD
jgi:hypothetical protein